MTVIVKVVADPKDVPTAPVDNKPTFVYWNIVGLANPCRLLLALTGVDAVDVRIAPGSPDDADSYKQTWLQAKTGRLTDAMPMPNLPYYIEEGMEQPFCQSDAILRYLAKKHNILGEPGKEYIVDMCLDELKDYESHLVMLSYVQGPDAIKTWLEESVPQMLAKWKKLIGDHKYLTGNLVSAADIKLYVFLSKLRILQDLTIGAALDNLQEWTGFMTSIESLPKLKDYLKSSGYMQGPLNNPHAKIN
jgi:glutathione S-transferase